MSLLKEFENWTVKTENGTTSIIPPPPDPDEVPPERSRSTPSAAATAPPSGPVVAYQPPNVDADMTSGIGYSAPVGGPPRSQTAAAAAAAVAGGNRLGQQAAPLSPPLVSSSGGIRASNRSGPIPNSAPARRRKERVKVRFDDAPAEEGGGGGGGGIDVEAPNTGGGGGGGGGSGQVPHTPDSGSGGGGGRPGSAGDRPVNATSAASSGALGQGTSPETMETSLLGKATGGRSKWGVVKKSLSNLKDRDVVVPAGEPKSPAGAGPSGAGGGGGDGTKSENLGSIGGRDEAGALPRLLPKSMPLVEGQGGAAGRPAVSKGPMTVRLEAPPRSNRSKMARQSVILCMDPNCNRCPPEMHMHMRKTMAPMSAPQPKPAKPKFNFNMADFEDEEKEEEEEVDEEEWVMVTVRCCGLKITYRRQLYFWRNFFSQFILPPVFSPHNKYVRMWMRGLIYISLVSFFTDPFFLFALSVNPDTYCIYTKNNWVYALCVVRSFVDFVTLVNMVLHSRLAFNATQLHLRGNKILNRWGEPVKLGELVIDDEKAILYNYLRHFFIYDVLCLIPIPQIVYLGVLPYIPAQQVASTWMVLLRLSVLLQFVPRIIRLYPVFSGTGGYQFVAESAWASFLLNLFTFSISSHVVGSVWYLLTVQRVSFCLSTVCMADGPQTCSMNSLSCQYYGPASQYDAGPNSYDSNLQMCLNGTDPVQPYGNSTSEVAFGMYSSGVQTTTTSVLIAQWLYALMWGFQQISTFAGNLVATTYIGEVLFMLFVMVLGIFLFALLIGNMQNFLQGLSRRSMEHQLHLRDVEKWMEQRDIPRDIQKRVRQLDRYVWSVNQGVNEEEVLSSLSEDIRRDVRRHLCLELIKKSRLFSSMDDMVQDAICDRLRQCLFIDKTVVIREGSPVSRMFFVLRGALESSTTNKGRTGFFESQFLSKGDFFGEELLVYFIEKYAGEKSRKSMGRSMRREVKTSSLLPDLLPKSERTVVCMGPVDGFTLEAADIDFVCTQFFRVMQSDKVQRALNVCSINRRTRAATTIQVWYRARVRRQLCIPLDIFRQAVRTRRIGSLLRQARAAAEGNPDGAPPPVPSSSEKKKKNNSGGLDSGSSQKGIPKSVSSKRSPNTSSEMPKGTKKTGRSSTSNSNNSSSDEGGRPTLVHSATTASPGAGEGSGSLFGKLVSFGRTVSAEEPEGGGALSSASPATGGGSGGGVAGGSGRLPRSSTESRGIVGRFMGSTSRASPSPTHEEPDEPAKKFEFKW